MGHIESQDVIEESNEAIEKAPNNQGLSRGKTGSVEHSQMVEVAGVEPAFKSF